MRELSEGVKKMINEVTTWYMSPEELAEYVKKHPIKSAKKNRGQTAKPVKKDYKWRSQKGADSRWANK